MSNEVDITPTWEEWGSVYKRLAEGGEATAIVHLGPDFDRMSRMATALVALSKSGTLTVEQSAIIKLATTKGKS